MGIKIKKQTDENVMEIRGKYPAYKVADIAVQLYLHGVCEDDMEFIMQGGENITMQPYDKLQIYLAALTERMESRLPAEFAKKIRRDSACCLSGKRETIARAICNNYSTVEDRFAALSNEHYIIGGKSWKDGEDYFISFWSKKPETGYVCACVRHVPEKPMSKLWCECCAGHIKHHFDTALGVESECECVSSVLSSCGESSCVFRFGIVKVVR